MAAAGRDPGNSLLLNTTSALLGEMGVDPVAYRAELAHRAAQQPAVPTTAHTSTRPRDRGPELPLESWRLLHYGWVRLWWASVRFVAVVSVSTARVERCMGRGYSTSCPPVVTTMRGSVAPVARR